MSLRVPITNMAAELNPSATTPPQYPSPAPQYVITLDISALIYVLILMLVSIVIFGIINMLTHIFTAFSSR